MLIETQPELDALVERLSAHPGLAIDCEMDSMYAYRTSLCLVQVGWEGGEALIDVLRELDMSRLGRLFADADRVKVFHGGENDVGLMRGHWAVEFENIFDTMAASQVLGHDGVGLAALLDRHFDIKVSKRFQKADWRVRPLPEKQAEYARIDVRYLLPLRRLLLDELRELRRVEEAESEFRRIGRACAEEKPFEPGNWVKVKGARDLPPEQRGTLAELYVARDVLARELDRAPYRVLHESALVDLARRQPRTAADLRRVHGINRGLSEAQVRRLLEAIERGLQVTDLPLPRRVRTEGDRYGIGPMTPEQTAVFDALRTWRQQRAGKRGVEVARVATNALLAAIVRAAPSTSAGLAAVDGFEDWRLREYGEELLAVLERASRAAGATGASGETDGA
jgi:ribonuclease D